MPRNLFERCEVVFPVRDPQLRARVRDEILAAYLADTVKARVLRADGSYARLREPGRDGGPAAFNAQDFFIAVAEGRADADAIPRAQAPSQAARPARKRTGTAAAD